MGVVVIEVKGDGPDRPEHIDLRVETGFVWIVLRTDENEQWHIQGVGTTEQWAVSMCVDETYFIGPLPLNSPFPEKQMEWVGSYFPLKQQ